MRISFGNKNCIKQWGQHNIIAMRILLQVLKINSSKFCIIGLVIMCSQSMEKKHQHSVIAVRILLLMLQELKINSSKFGFIGMFLINKYKYSLVSLLRSNKRAGWNKDHAGAKTSRKRISVQQVRLLESV